MKLLFIVSHYYPYMGGVEYVVKSVAERLARKGHEVNVFCGEPGIGKPREEVVNGVSVVRWPVWSPGDAYHIPRMRSSLKRWLLGSVKDYDVVHFHSVHSVFTMYSLSVLRGSRVQKVLTPHYHGTGHTLFRRLLWKGWRRFVKSALRYVDVVHTVSNVEALYVTRNFCVKPLTIEHGVEEWLSNISWNPSDYIMYSGRIEKYKNIHRLVKIVKILNETGLDLKLKIFGDGPFKRKLLSFFNRLKVEYELNPPQPYKEYIHYLSKATLFGLLSEKEAFGQTVNEANALGVPVVVVEPWGLNFKERTRTLITKLSKSDEEIAKEIATFLEEARKQPKSKVPSWNQVVDLYIKSLYSS
ncbi:MAG: glycosyltransferase family 4 protein [Thermoproteota archaeon]